MTDWRDVGFSEFERLNIKDGELYVRSAKSTVVEYRNEEIEALKEEDERGGAVRIINNGKLGFSYTSSLKPEAIKTAIENAYEFSRFTGENPYYQILSQDLPPQDVNVYDPEIPELDVEELTAYARRIEKAARTYDERAKDFRMISVKRGYGTIGLFTGYGIQREYDFTYIYLLVELIAEENGEKEMGYEVALSPFLSQIDPEEVGRNAAYKALAKLGGRMYKTGKFPVIFNPEAEAELLHALFPAFSGENVMKGKSIFKDMLGKMVASSSVTLVNDGRLPDGISSSPFDDEGVPTQRTELILEGRLNSFLHTLYSAKYFGVESTGSGFRASMKSLPGVTPANLHILPGKMSPKDLISSIEEGIYVTSIIGAHTINPISGDFSVGITGALIEKGEISYPLKGMTLAGNLKDLLKGIKIICNDLRFFPEGVGGSTVLVEGLSIGGK